MITRALRDYLMKNNYSLGLDDSMNANNNSVIHERKGPKIRTKNRREPTIGYNETLLIELGIVVTVVTVVGLVFYFSHRNYKKRSNVHRRRWLESDVTIDNYSDGQIYGTNTTLEESEPNDQDDFPPSYESVVKQSSSSSKRKRGSKISKHNSNGNLSKSHDECPHYTTTNNNCSRNLEPLMSSQPLNFISTICTEDSSLIDRHSASTSSSVEENNSKSDKCYTDDRKLEYQRLQESQSIGVVRAEVEKGTNEKRDIVPIKKVGHDNEIALLDASGLPTYDTALKIQECGNI